MKTLASRIVVTIVTTVALVGTNTVRAQDWVPPPTLVPMGDSYILEGSSMNMHVQDVQQMQFQYQCRVVQPPVPPALTGQPYVFTHTYNFDVVAGQEDSGIEQALPLLQADENDCEAHDGSRTAQAQAAIFTGQCAPGTFNYEEDADYYIPTQGWANVLFTTPVNIYGSPGSAGYANAMASLFPWYIRNHGANCVMQFAGSNSGAANFVDVSTGAATRVASSPTHLSGMWLRAKCDIGFHWTPVSWWIDGPYPGGVALWSCLPGPSTSSCGPCDQANGNILEGHPINPGTGNKYLHEVDIDSYGPSSLTMERDYNSQTDGMGFALEGPGWTSNQFYNIQFHSQRTQVEVFRATGQTVGFNFDGSTFSPAIPNTTDSLTLLSNGGYRFISHDGWIEDYSPAGQVVTRTRIDGYQLNYTYAGGTAGNAAQVSFAPSSVTDSYGRSLSFHYGTDGTLSSVTGAGGYTVTYGAEIRGDGTVSAATVTYPGGKVIKYLYGSTNFDGTTVPASMLITGVVDGNGTQYSTYTYDQQGRGTSTSLAGGYETYKMNYVMSDPNSTAWETDVTDPLGTVRHKHYAVSTNGIQLTGNDQPGGSGCDAATESAVYDSYGNKYQEGDFNGNLVCHAYDLTTKLMTTTVEGLSASNAASYCSPLARAGTQLDLSAMPAGARATSYAWHPVWRLRAKVASPLQLTTYVYNGQPDPFHGGSLANCVSGNAQLPDGSPLAVLCEAVTQATKDATGAAGLYPVIDSTVPARSVSYSYDALGKVLSRTDSLNHTTTYSYYQDKTTDHNIGDLWKVTNAANQVTTYTKYDAAGRVLQTVEPNGVTTDITYTARGLPYTITKTPYGGGTAMSTTFGYDLADQLKTVVGSDGTSLTYGYDDAHHLKTITDAAGNTVTYTLDNAGNRTGEDVKDVSGNLATTVTRVFDALGRLQAVTGALN